MKHNIKITALLLSMFVITQIIGLVIIHADPLTINQVGVDGEIEKVSNPALAWIEPPAPETQGGYAGVFTQLIIAFIIAIVLLFILMRFKIEFFLRFWFFAVVCIALIIAIIAIEKLVPWTMSLKTGTIIAVALAIPLAAIKIYGKNLLVHNMTEFFIYPGIAVVFIPLLNVYTIIALLILISLYDMWAVWRSGIMQKMAKYQINNLKIFSGFFVPYMSKKQKLQMQKIKAARAKSKSKKEKTIKVNVGILGGGDIVFPIITAGVMFVNFGLVAAVLTIVGATMGLTYLFFVAEKKKFYPAMPFITIGMFIGMAVSWLIYL